MLDYFKKKISNYLKVWTHNFDRKFIHPTFEDQKNKLELSDDETKLLELWEFLLRDKRCLVLSYNQHEHIRILDYHNIKLILTEGYGTYCSLTIIKISGKKNVCLEVSISDDIGKLFKISFEDEILKRTQSIQNLKKDILSQSLDQAISELNSTLNKVTND